MKANPLRRAAVARLTRPSTGISFIDVFISNRLNRTHLFITTSKLASCFARYWGGRNDERLGSERLVDRAHLGMLPVLNGHLHVYESDDFTMKRPKIVRASKLDGLHVR